MEVIKRDGTKVPFDKDKIINAISKAGYVDERTKADIACYIQMSAEAKVLSVEDIQNLVEEGLMKDYPQVAKEYIRYRYKREIIRKAKGANAEILDIINLSNQDVNEENSNKNPVILSTQRDYMAGAVSKELSRELLFPPEVMKAHDAGIIHVHDMDYSLQKMYNCFHSSTEFITNKGIRAFESCKDGEKVCVLTKLGMWSEATVHMYGKREMQEVTLTNGRTTKKVRCTPDHRWILVDDVVTQNLKVGDRLKYLKETMATDCFDMEAFVLGFVLGDGCDIKNGMRVRLCGDKIKLLPYFENCGWLKSSHKFEGSEDVLLSKVTKQRKADFLNCKGWRYLPYESLNSLFLGYYAADGSKDSNRLSTADANLATMIEEISCVAGYHITSKKTEVRDTNYKKGATLYSYHFMTHQTPNMPWRVVDIKLDKRGAVYNAWCVEEPLTHSFTLAGGVVTGNCCLVNLEDMLQNGTVINGTLIEKPHSFATACNIATQIMAQIASNQYGGQSITLSHLAPFVDVSRQKIRHDLYDELRGEGLATWEDTLKRITEKRLKQEIARGVQTMQYQINTLMTSNGQTPFVTLFMYLNEVKDPQTKADLAMIIEEVVKQRLQGTKNEKGVYVTPAFPKLIYVLEEDNITEGSKYWDLTKLCAKCSAKRLVPDYVSEKIMLRDKTTEDGRGWVYPPMGCRSFLTPYLDKDGNGKYYGRFNQGVVTINLVDVALSADKDFDKFWEIYENRLELCHTALRCRHQHLRGTISDVSPIHWQYGAIARLKKGETIDKLLEDNYSTISLGYAGLYECVKAMTGKSHTDPEAKPFALAVMQKLNDKCKEWRAKEGIGYSVYGTPIETTTYKFAKCLQSRFGIIKGITDRDYITNSYHVHVTEPIDAFTKLAFEADFQKLSPGGAISYIETCDMSKNIEAVLAVLQFIYDNIMYAELNCKSDYCQVCGYDGEIQIVTDHNKLQWRCPNCGNMDKNKMNVARRTCGYIGSQFWNQGRTEEIRDRFVHLGGDYEGDDERWDK